MRSRSISILVTAALLLLGAGQALAADSSSSAAPPAQGKASAPAKGTRLRQASSGCQQRQGIRRGQADRHQQCVEQATEDAARHHRCRGREDHRRPPVRQQVATGQPRRHHRGDLPGSQDADRGQAAVQGRIEERGAAGQAEVTAAAGSEARGGERCGACRSVRPPAGRPSNRRLPEPVRCAIPCAGSCRGWSSAGARCGTRRSWAPCSRSGAAGNVRAGPVQ